MLDLGLLKEKNDWNGILKACGCTTNTISEQVITSSDRQLLLDVAMAYGQLSNLRRIKDKNTHKFVGYNTEEANDCFNCTKKMYQHILSMMPSNKVALQSYAYNYYKYIISYFGTNKKEIKSMNNVDIADCFKQISKIYETLLSIGTLSLPSCIKARYRRGKAYSELVFNYPVSSEAKSIIISLSTSRNKICYLAIQDFLFVIDTYEKLNKEEKESIYSIYVKSKYTLGKLYSENTYDNAFSPIQELDNKTIAEVFIKNPSDIDLSHYKQLVHDGEFEKAENLLLSILKEYGITPYVKMNMQALVNKDKKYPLSLRHIFYQLGKLYSKWYQICAIPNKRRDIKISKAYSGIYFYFAALQFCLWCKKLHIPCAYFDYIPKYLDILKRMADIKKDDTHIKNMHRLFENILKK
mgnify:CR=1 FL=1